MRWLGFRCPASLAVCSQSVIKPDGTYCRQYTSTYSQLGLHVLLVASCLNMVRPVRHVHALTLSLNPGSCVCSLAAYHKLTSCCSCCALSSGSRLMVVPTFGSPRRARMIFPGVYKLKTTTCIYPTQLNSASPTSGKPLAEIIANFQKPVNSIIYRYSLVASEAQAYRDIILLAECDGCLIHDAQA